MGGEILRILRILEDSWGFLGIPENSWGFLRIPGDSRGFLRILRIENHGVSQDSEGFCYNPWGFSGILRVYSKTVRGFLSVEPLGTRDIEAIDFTSGQNLPERFSAMMILPTHS